MSIELSKLEPLSKYSTFGVGGPADIFCTVDSVDGIKDAINLSKEYGVPYFILGGGSNILFADEGFRGVIIKISSKKVTFFDEDTDQPKVKADAGVSIATLLNQTIQHGFCGLEKWTGLPGTVGGAVRGNAGCNGLDTSQILLSATLFDPIDQNSMLADSKNLNYSYRESSLKNSNLIVLDATFQLQKSINGKDFQIAEMQKIRQERQEKQPWGLSGGSFFKNPSQKNPAGKIIEECGLKGFQIGGAQVSEKHANFIINSKNATSQDIKSLARHIQKTVKEQKNIQLEPEVQILSEIGKATL